MRKYAKIPSDMPREHGKWDIRNAKPGNGKEWYALANAESGTQPWVVWKWNGSDNFYDGQYFRKETDAVQYFNKAARRTAMRRTAITEQEVYKFDELDDRAKEKARDWYREGALDYEWWDGLEEQFKKDGENKGFEIDEMFFSGFSSQGDGASWVGAVNLLQFIESEGAKSQFPAFLKYMKEMGGEEWGDPWVGITQSGNYSHENTMHSDPPYAPSINENFEEVEDWSEDEIEKFNDALEKEMDELDEWALEEARYYAQEYYRALEKEYEWLMDDEQVDENIIANDYEFDEDGNRH